MQMEERVTTQPLKKIIKKDKKNYIRCPRDLRPNLSPKIWGPNQGPPLNTIVLPWSGRYQEGPQLGSHDAESR